MTDSAPSETKSQGGKLIALTFDDGPSSYTNRLLDGLAARGIRATFFMAGNQAEYQGETVRRVYREGHEIAQHTYDHPMLTTQSAEQIAWQLSHTRDILNEKLNKNFTYILRPPGGDINDRVRSLIGVPAIIWSIDPVDWRDRDAYTVRDRIVNRAFDGAIVLTHDTLSTTVSGVLMAIDILKEQGYEFVTISELYRRRGVELQNGVCYYSCKPTGVDYGEVLPPTVGMIPHYGGNMYTLHAREGTKIYYTTDGSDPAVNGVLYTKALALEPGMTLKAVAAYKINGDRSKTMTYNVGYSGQLPYARKVGDKIILIDPNGGCDIYYTTDGSMPNENSAKYNQPLDWFVGTLRFRVMGMGICGQPRTIYATKRGNLFWDIPSDQWYYDEVDRAVTLGIFTGVDEYRFSPEKSLTRAMFVTALYRLMGEPEVTAADTFSDVESGLWYSDAALWATGEKIVLGYEDNTFRPDKIISRQEMCVMLDRLLRSLGANATDETADFADGEQIAPWAREAVASVVACGLMKGVENNRFAPLSTATRAQAAAVLLRLYDYMDTILK